MKRCRNTRVGLAVLAVLGAAQCNGAAAEHFASVQTEALQAVVADNDTHGADHRAGYNGVSELRLKSGEPESQFVPLYAGSNFETIFSGDAASFGWDIFEPRRAPMQLARLSDTKVELRQDRTEHWPLRSRLQPSDIFATTQARSLNDSTMSRL